MDYVFFFTPVSCIFLLAKATGLPIIGAEFAICPGREDDVSPLSRFLFFPVLLRACFLASNIAGREAIYVKLFLLLSNEANILK